MKSVKSWAGIILLIAGLALMGSCSLPCFWEEFEGTWIMSNGLSSETLKITKEDMIVTDAGAYNGVMKCNVLEYDIDVNTLLISVTSTTGDFTTIPNGTQYYIKYNISGKMMYMGMSITSYPTTTNLGPYTKQ